MTPDDSLQLLKNLKLKINGQKIDRTEVSSVTTAWGVDWTEEMVARDLLQNFFDANRGRVSEIQKEIGDRRLKGEITLVISGKTRKMESSP